MIEPDRTWRTDATRQRGSHGMMLSAEGRVDLSETVKAACKQAYQGICHPVTELQGLSQRALKRQVRHPAASRVRVGDELALAHRGSPRGPVCPETSGYAWINCGESTFRPSNVRSGSTPSPAGQDRRRVIFHGRPLRLDGRPFPLHQRPVVFHRQRVALRSPATRRSRACCWRWRCALPRRCCAPVR